MRLLRRSGINPDWLAPACDKRRMQKAWTGLRGAVWGVNEAGEQGASAPEPPRRAHHASTQPVGKGLAATAGGGAMADSDDERDVMQCDDRRFKAMVRDDLAALRTALADSLTYTHTSGVHDTKAQFLGSLTPGQLSYKSIIPEARLVRVYGGAGIVAGTARMEITARGQDRLPQTICAP